MSDELNFEQWDTNLDGFLDSNEIEAFFNYIAADWKSYLEEDEIAEETKVFRDTIAAMDTNQDGKVSRQEMIDYQKKLNEKKKLRTK